VVFVLVINGDFVRSTFRQVSVEEEDSKITFLRHNGDYTASWLPLKYGEFLAVKLTLSRSSLENSGTIRRILTIAKRYLYWYRICQYPSGIGNADMMKTGWRSVWLGKPISIVPS
jgi:hypothetical protein